MSINQIKLPEKKYERSMQHNYMILQEENIDGKMQYKKRMLLENQIQGLLPASLRYIDGMEAYYYEINATQSLDRIFERQNIGKSALLKIIESYLQLQKQLELYLLSCENIILNPAYIYMNPTDGKICYTFYPEYEKDGREAFQEFMEYLLQKTDHTDEKAVMFVYQLYKYTREDNFVVDEMKKMLVDLEEPIVVEPKMEIENQTIWNESEIKEEVSKIEKPLPQNELEELYAVKSRKTFHRIISYICLVCAMICVGLLGLLKSQVIALPKEYEMLLFIGVILFAVACMLCRKLQVKQQEQAPVMQEIEKEQNTRIQDCVPKEDKTFFKETNQSSQMDKIYDFFPSEPAGNAQGETMVLGMETTEPSKKLLCRKDGVHKEQYEINKFPFLIGRMQEYVDLVIEDNTISKMHARIDENKEGKVVLQDLNSTNGIKRNGTILKPNEAVILETGDEIELGKVIFCYQ